MDKTKTAICDIWFKSVSGTLEDLLDRHIELAYDHEPVHIGRSSKRFPERGVPEQHNALYTSAVVSRTHASLYVNADMHIFLKDVASTHGTYVNNQKLLPGQPMQLFCGDRVALGSDIKSATGPSHSRVCFDVEFSVLEQSINTDPEDVNVQPSTEPSRGLKPSPEPSVHGIATSASEEEAIEVTNDTADDKYHSPPTTSRGPFSVPSISDDSSDTSELEWLDEFEYRRFDDELPMDANQSFNPALELTPSSDSLASLTGEVKADGTAFVSKMATVQSEATPRQGINPDYFWTEPHASPHSRTEGAKVSSSPELSAAALEEASQRVLASAEIITNTMASSRERLSIQNLISSPSRAFPDANQTVIYEMPLQLPSKIPLDTLQPKVVIDLRDSPAQKPTNTAELELQGDALIISEPERKFKRKRCENLLDEAVDDEPSESSLYQQAAMETLDVHPRKRACLDVNYTDPEVCAPDFSQPRQEQIRRLFPSAASFVLGTVFGGVAVLGGLIAMPESFFS